MKKEEVLRRYIFLFIALFVSGLGVSFITKAGLGTSPITSIPYTLSLGFAPTVGMFTFAFNAFLMVIQVVLLREDFKAADLLQLPVVLVFSFFIDLTMAMLSAMNPQMYAMKMLSLVIGCGILGFGVFMEMVADVVMLPGEATVRAVTKVFGTDFGKTKIVLDTSMTIIAVVISFIMFKNLQGVREGTVIAAFLVGFIARLLKKTIGGIEKILIPKEKIYK